MKNAKIEMRIEKVKKEQLSRVASEMGLKVSEVVDLLIEDFLKDNQLIVSDINRNCKIATLMMNINDLATSVEGDIRIPLLRELGELECLL